VSGWGTKSSPRATGSSASTTRPTTSVSAERCRATEPGTLQFEIMLPHDEADTILLYEVYASPEAFQEHWNGPSLKQTQRETEGLVLSLKGTRCELVE